MTEFDHVKDSGERQKFETGAVRDTQSGKGRYDLLLTLPHMLYRLARHFENGAVKYGDDNWRKGMPLRRFIDSAFRHLCQYAAGSRDEDHLTAVVWNLMCHGETANEITAGRLPSSLDDMPHYEQGGRTPEERTAFLTTCMEATACPDCKTHHLGPCPSTWYIAGPMRGLPQSNFPAFDEAVNAADLAGMRVISPANMDRAVGFNPGTDEITPEILREIIQRDTEAIRNLDPTRGDGLILLQGWEKSVGCRAEVPLALWLGVKNFRLFDEGAFFNRTPGYITDMLFCQEQNGRGMC